MEVALGHGFTDFKARRKSLDLISVGVLTLGKIGFYQTLLHHSHHHKHKCQQEHRKRRCVEWYFSDTLRWCRRHTVKLFYSEIVLEFLYHLICFGLFLHKNTSLWTFTRTRMFWCSNVVGLGKQNNDGCLSDSELSWGVAVHRTWISWEFIPW